MSVKSKMTTIADLIRGLRNVSGTMGLDAMAGHLQDEQAGLASALAALTEKGVTVPAGTKVDDLAALISGIEAGGGSGDGGGLEITSGIVVPSSTTCGTFNFSHGLGRIPTFFAFFPKTDIDKELVYNQTAALGFFHYNGVNISVFTDYDSLSSKGYSKSIYITDTNLDTFATDRLIKKVDTTTARFNGANWSTYIFAGNEYIWFAG